MENGNTKETWGKKENLESETAVISLYETTTSIRCGRQYFYDVHSSSGLKYHRLNFQRNVAKKSEFSTITTELEAICFFVLEEQWMNN